MPLSTYREYHLKVSGFPDIVRKSDQVRHFPKFALIATDLKMQPPPISRPPAPPDSLIGMAKSCASLVGRLFCFLIGSGGALLALFIFVCVIRGCFRAQNAWDNSILSPGNDPGRHERR
jgi:hypothetical protein